MDVFSGIKDGGKIIINTTNDLKIKEGVEVQKIDATGISLEILGVPIVNTVMLGAFAGVTGEVSLESLVKVIKETFKGPIGEKRKSS